MQHYNDQDEYENYGDIDRPFTPNQMEDDESTHYTKSPLYGAADDSHMEDVSEQKWQHTTKVEDSISGTPLPS